MTFACGHLTDLTKNDGPEELLFLEGCAAAGVVEDVPLQWDFGDFESIKSELRVPKFNEPVDYAFFSSKKKTDTPILLLEAKRLGSDLAHKNHVKQLTAYLGATGVQWGVLSDGNRAKQRVDEPLSRVGLTELYVPRLGLDDAVFQLQDGILE